MMFRILVLQEDERWRAVICDDLIEIAPTRFHISDMRLTASNHLYREATRIFQPDLIIMSWGHGGVQILPYLQAQSPKTEIWVISAFQKKRLYEEAAAADLIIPKDSYSTGVLKESLYRRFPYETIDNKVEIQDARNAFLAG